MTCFPSDICHCRKFYLSCIDDEESSEDEGEVIASHGVLAEQHEKPDDLLDNYFLLGEDDFEVGFDSLCKAHLHNRKNDYRPVKKVVQTSEFCPCILCV